MMIEEERTLMLQRKVISNDVTVARNQLTKRKITTARLTKELADAQETEKLCFEKHEDSLKQLQQINADLQHLIESRPKKRARKSKVEMQKLRAGNQLEVANIMICLNQPSVKKPVKPSVKPSVKQPSVQSVKQPVEVTSVQLEPVQSAQSVQSVQLEQEEHIKEDRELFDMFLAGEIDMSGLEYVLHM